MTRSDVGDKEKMIKSIQILTILGPVTYFLDEGRLLEEGLSKDRKAHKRNFKKGLPAPHKNKNARAESISAIKKKSFLIPNEDQDDGMDSGLAIIDSIDNFDLNVPCPLLFDDTVFDPIQFNDF